MRRTPSRGTTAATTASTHTGWASPNTATPAPGVPVQHFLDFAAGNVFAAGFDHVLFAVHDVQQTVLVVAAEVPE